MVSCDLLLGVQGPVEYNRVLEKLLPSNWNISSLQGSTIFVHDEVKRNS